MVEKAKRYDSPDPDFSQATVKSPSSSSSPSMAATGLATDVSVADFALTERVLNARDIVKNHVIAAGAASLVPVPLVDVLALTGIQLKMLHSLARLYQVPFQKQLGKKLIVALLGGVMPTSVAINAASFAKVIPGLGTATGIASVAVLGSAATYAIGSVFIQHFESGGTLLNFDPKAMRAHFAEELQRGKVEADRLRSAKR